MEESIKRLKDFRQQHRIKLLDLASFSGIHHTRLSPIENAYYKISETDIEKIINGYQKLGISSKEDIENMCKLQNKDIEIKHREATSQNIKD